MLFGLFCCSVRSNLFRTLLEQIGAFDPTKKKKKKKVRMQEDEEPEPVKEVVVPEGGVDSAFVGLKKKKKKKPVSCNTRNRVF